MPVDESHLYFSACDPWESLDPAQRALRVLRIVVGCALYLFFLMLAALCTWGFFFAHNYGDMALTALLVACLLLLNAAIGRTLIWRRERKYPLPHLDEDQREEGPDDPPPDDAPRPAPLIPFSPKVLSATAPLDEE